MIGRKLDYQTAYGSPAVFPHARFIRIADNAGELIDNRRGEPELFATPALALAAIVEAAGNRPPNIDKAWADGLRAKQQAALGAQEDRSGARRRRQDPSRLYLRCHRRHCRP